MKTKKKQNGGKYYQKLVEFDNEYYAFNPDYDTSMDECHAWRISTESNLCHALATYSYDHDIELNDEGWNLLEKIRNHFGTKVRNKVLYNLFHRHHDT